MITLILSQGKDSRPLHFEQDLITVGRSRESAISIQDRKISRQHAKIERIGATYQITDLDSGNGTRVNGQKVDFQVLNVGDQIKVGDALLDVRAIDEEPVGTESEAELLPDVPAAEASEPTDVQLPRPARRVAGA